MLSLARKQGSKSNLKWWGNKKSKIKIWAHGLIIGRRPSKTEISMEETVESQASYIKRPHKRQKLNKSKGPHSQLGLAHGEQTKLSREKWQEAELPHPQLRIFNPKFLSEDCIRKDKISRLATGAEAGHLYKQVTIQVTILSVIDPGSQHRGSPHTNKKNSWVISIRNTPSSQLEHIRSAKSQKRQPNPLIK